MTVCTQNRECLFGEIHNGEMELNRFGIIILDKWNRIPNHFKNIQLDTFQIMPNHIHGILFIIDIVGAKHSGKHSDESQANQTRNASPLQNRPNGTKPGSLPAVMQNYLSITTRKINQIRKTPGNKLWQRNYYEHIIRDEDELNTIRKYIIYNPLKWEWDKENPENRKNIK